MPSDVEAGESSDLAGCIQEIENDDKEEWIQQSADSEWSPLTRADWSYASSRDGVGQIIALC